MRSSASASSKHGAHAVFVALAAGRVGAGEERVEVEGQAGLLDAGLGQAGGGEEGAELFDGQGAGVRGIAKLSMALKASALAAEGELSATTMRAPGAATRRISRRTRSGSGK